MKGGDAKTPNDKTLQIDNEGPANNRPFLFYKCLLVRFIVKVGYYLSGLSGFVLRRAKCRTKNHCKGAAGSSSWRLKLQVGIMDDFETIEKAFDMIQESLEKVRKRKLTTFGRDELKKFTAKVTNLTAEAFNLKFETGG